MLKESMASALCKIQKSRGLTDEELATLLQLPRATVRAALQGRADLPIGTVERIAGQLQLNPMDLVSDFRGDQAQIESLAGLLKPFVDQPLERRLELARILRNLLFLMDGRTVEACSSPPAMLQAAETELS